MRLTHLHEVIEPCNRHEYMVLVSTLLHLHGKKDSSQTFENAMGQCIEGATQTDRCDDIARPREHGSIRQ